MQVIKMKREYPLVSICITSFNYERFILDAVDSAVAQTYPNIEVLVSDNCSTDGTMQLLERYALNPRVRVVRNSENIGMVQNHNIAIKRAQGEYIVLLSADDVLFPDHVARLMQRMHDMNDPVDIVYAHVMTLDTHLNALKARAYRGALSVGYSGRDDLASVLTNYYHAFPAKLIPKRVYEHLGYFDESIHYAFDVDFCARIEHAEYHIASIPDIVAGLREHEKRSSTGEWMRQEGYLRDKVGYLEKFVNAENAWRLEGCEKQLFGILDYELHQVEQAQNRQLEPELRKRYVRILETLSEMNRSRPAWPANRPQISVIVTSDGYFPLLQQSLDSLFAQTFGNFEIIVVHGEGWGVQGWLRTLPAGPRIRYVKAGNLRSFGEARKIALHVARGQFVTYLAEGQRVLPYHLERLLFCIQHANAEVGFCDNKSFMDDGFGIPFDEEKRAHVFEEPFVRAERLAKPGVTPLATVIHRRAIFRQLPHLEDAYFSLSDDELVAHFRLQHTHAAVSNADPAIDARYIQTQTFDGFVAGRERSAFLQREEHHREIARAQYFTAITR